MEDSRRARTRRAASLALVLLALVALGANVAGAAMFGDQAPYLGFVDLARMALPGMALAVAAVWLALLDGAELPAGLMLLASSASAAPALSVGLEQRAALWVSVGAAGHLLAPTVLVLALLFPRGRLEDATSRRTAAVLAGLGLAAGAAVVLTYDPGGWGWCRCVGNPWAVLDSGATSYPRVGAALAVTDLVVLVVGLVGLVRLVATRPQPGRGIPLAFLGAYVVVVACWAFDDVERLRLVAGSAPPPVPALADGALTALAVLFLAGHLSHRPSRAHVADLLLAAREEHDTERLRALVGRAIGDPRARVDWWDPATATFRDGTGRAVAVADHGVLRVEAAGRPIALVSADRLDSVDAGVRDSVAQALLLAAENRRLTAELQASLDQVRDSRARIVAAEDATRRRIERDLHDGAQQLLISTGIKLNLAAARAADDESLSEFLGGAAAELNRALAELRNLASGIAPTSLVHGSLRHALDELALRSSVPTSVYVAGSGEPDAAVAVTVYFVVAECLANVAKHADATRATVDVALGDPLRVSVVDDGAGGATLVGSGTGLRGLVDRVESRGGRLQLTSGSSGTTVIATLPATRESS